MIKGFDYFLSAVTVMGTFFLGRKFLWGWFWVIGVAILWIVYAIMLSPPQYGLIPASLVNIVIGISSYLKWRRDDKLQKAD